jgi:cytochrome c553
MLRALILLSVTVACAQQNHEDAARRVLAGKCWTCHAATAAGGLRLDQRSAMLRGGKGGAAIVPGKPAESRLLMAVNHQPGLKPMPPGPKLGNDEIAALRQWIEAGAPWTEPQQHWSFLPLQPKRQSIDAHVDQALARQGLQANPKADHRTLVRRLSFDLTGLPPSPEALADTRPGWYERLVDRLLASPRFGEKWGRHWLDVARYGEDDFGGTAVVPYANAWRYRDWVIGAFNRDLRYDEFLKAQLAADLLPGQQELPALGLFGLGPWYYGISQPPQARADERHDRVDMVSRGILGITVACARCHDHKYDPFSIEDYYALAGVFASTKYQEYPLAPEVAVDTWKSRKQAKDEAEKALHKYLDEQGARMAIEYLKDTPRYLLGLPGGNPTVAARWRKYLEKPEEFHPFLDRWFAGERTREQAEAFTRLLLNIVEEKAALDAANQKVIDAAKAKESKPARSIVLPGGYRSEEDFNPGAFISIQSLERDRYVAWNRTLNEANAPLKLPREFVAEELAQDPHYQTLRQAFEAAAQVLPPQYSFIAGLGEDAPWDLGVHLRGNPENLGKVVTRRFPTVLGGQPLTVGSGRLALANAVNASPLMPRVAVNRVWQQLFGEGLVRTPSNFGKVGDRPALPHLLDDLADRFAQRGYSTKALIREIVLSDAYQRSAQANAANDTKDAANRFVWRQSRRRLEAEALLDAMLVASNEMDWTIGGPSQTLDARFRRRAVYARSSRFQQEETLSLFDLPSAASTCEQRVVTNVPLQKLYFLNSDVVRSRAVAVAKSSRGVQGVYEAILRRPPTKHEQRRAEHFVRQAGADGLAQLAQVLFSSNEFAYVD